MDKRKKREQILFNLIAAAVLLLFLFPIYWMVITSLKSSKEIFAEVPTFFPEKIELEGYIQFCHSGSHHNHLYLAGHLVRVRAGTL